MSDNSDFRYLECNDDKKSLPSGMHIAAIWEGLKKPYSRHGPIRFEAIGFDFPSFTERHK